MKRTHDHHRPTPSEDAQRARAERLALYGVLAHWDELARQPWLPQLLEYEEQERTRRSLERRIHNARIGSFKPLADFDWQWPEQVDREAIDELFQLQFLAEGANVVLLGPNGVGKTMVLKNLAHHTVLRGHTVRFVTASDMLNDLAVADTSSALGRRLQRYCRPRLLCVDEVGYLAYDSRYADLLFEVVTRRYDAHNPVAISTNKPFARWSDVFPNAACVVTLVDRLIHRSELLEIQGKSYRLKEAQERAAAKRRQRRSAKSTRSSKPRSQTPRAKR